MRSTGTEAGETDTGPHGAGLVVERDEGRARADARYPTDGLFGRLLEVEVERGPDLEPAAERGAGSVSVDELLLHPGSEIGRLADLARRPAGGPQNDTIWGWSGADTLYGNDHNDMLDGGNHNDVLRAGDGDDEIFGRNNEDILHCGPGWDHADGGGHLVADILLSSTNHGCEEQDNIP